MAAKEFAFRGHLNFPLSLAGATVFNKEQVGSYYSHNEAGEGGWYPIGANQMWHNGIHLAAARGTPVRSIARGRLVAARLGQDYSTDKYPFGSPRFVLIKHKLTLLKNPTESEPDKWQGRDVEFYSMYMHLDCTPSELGDVPWLQSFLPFLSRDVPVSGMLARINVVEDAPPGGKKLGLNCRRAPTENENGKWVKGDVVTVLPMGTIVERCEERRGSYQQVNVPSMKLSDVWVYDEGNRLEDIPTFTEQVKALQAGGCAKLDY
ncbi:MAG TPA: M23 family metallopeptidase, partial [Myxococcaceae bacterium]|nr:M23 family metallopeptidase [Myxococcaceae bacterium]